MREFARDERRARLGLRHRLAVPAATVESVAGDLVGLHSSDPATVYLSALARVDGFAVADLEAALYERRSLVRMLGMRRTMFVVPPDLAAVMDAACTRALAPAERRRLIGLLEDQDVTGDGAAWLEDVEERVMAALQARGEATAVELTADEPELGRKLTFGEGKTWGGTVGVSTRVLFLLATEGRILRTRPRGSWVSSQYRWAPAELWLDGGLVSIDSNEARTELARRWLRTYGPGTVTDLKWWTGWGVRQTRETLAAVGAVEVGLEGETGYVLADDVDPIEDGDPIEDVDPIEVVAPWVALLPGLDPTVMGWKDRDWYLGDHRLVLFDRNGNAGPTVWADGRVVGGWGQRSTGEVAVTLLEDVGSATADAIHTEAGRLEAWLGNVRITPRFRTPLEKALS